jgi:Sec-independent protein translocase protein TatA
VFGSLDPAKLLVILVIALIVLGPDRLPKVARQMGAAWHELTRIRDQVTDEVRAAIPTDMIPNIPRPVPGSITGFVNNLTTPQPKTIVPEANTEQASQQLLDGMEADGQENVHPPSRPDVFVPTPALGDTVPRTAPSVIVHPALGDVAILPDDPGMN